jgi:hypothetical protein
MIKLIRIEDVPDRLLYIGMKLGIVVERYVPGILLGFKPGLILVHWKNYGNFEYKPTCTGYHNIAVEVGKCKKLNELWEKDRILVDFCR